MYILINKNRILKKVVSVILVIVNIVTITLFTYSASNSSSSLSISSLSNGSPLLSDSWSSTGLTLKDHYALSLYLSSMLYPGIDSYRSAFFENNGGSNGEMAKAISFSDENTQESINKYVSVIVQYQLQAVAQASSTGTLADYDEKTVRFLHKKGDEDNYVKVSDLINCTGFLPDYSIKTDFADELVVKKINSNENASSTDEYLTVYNPNDDINRICFAYAQNISVTQKFSAYKESLKQMGKDEYILFLDSFGNICALNSNINNIANDQYSCVIIFPNCYNPNIMDGKINLITYLGLTTVKLGYKVSSGFGVFGTNLNASNFENNSINISYYKEGEFFAFGEKSGFINEEPVSGKKFINKYYDYTGVAGATFSPIDLFISNGTTYISDDDITYSGKVLNYKVSMFPNEEYNYLAYNRLVNKKVFFNFLVMCYADSLTGIKDIPKVDIENYCTVDEEQINSDTGAFESVTIEEQKKGGIKLIWSILTSPATLGNMIMSWLSILWVGLYELTSDYKNMQANEKINTLGYTNLDSLPVISSELDFIDNHLDQILFIVFLICFILGALNQQVVPTFVRTLLCLFILIIYPSIFNFMNGFINSQINQWFASNQNSWILSYNKQWEQNVAKMDSTYASLYDDISYESSSALKYVQEKSPVILSNSSSEVNSILSTSGFGYLFLGSLLKQYRTGNNISSTVDELFKRLIMTSYTGAQVQSDNETVLSVGSGYWANLFRKKIINPNSSSVTKLSEYGIEDTLNSVTESSSYSLKDLTPSFTYNEVNDDGTGQNTYGVGAKAINSNHSHTSFFLLSDSVQTIYDKYFANNISSSDTTAPISKFNYEVESHKFDGNYGYFLLSENVIPYFYMVYLDTFIDCNKQEIGYLLQGQNTGETSTKIDAFNKEQTVPNRDSILLKNSQAIDYADLKTLFRTVVPYCLKISEEGRAAFKNDLIGDDYTIYKLNKKSWLFDCNWAIKLVNNYSLDDINSTDLYCEYGSTDHTDSSINTFNDLCVEFYNALTPQMENLIEHINDSNINKYILIRQMAMLTGIQFNKTFSMEGGELQPQYIEAGSVGMDTLWKDLLTTNGYQVNEDKSAAASLVDNGGAHAIEIILMIICNLVSCLLIPAIKAYGIGFFSAIIPIILCFVVLDQNRENQVPIFTTLFGIFTTYAKILFLCAGSTISLLYFSSLELGSSQNSISLSLQIIIITAINIMLLYMIPQAVLGGLGWAKENGKLVWSRKNMLTFGGQGTMDSIQSGLTAVKNVAKTMVATTTAVGVGGALAGTGLLAAATTRIPATKKLATSIVNGTEGIVNRVGGGIKAVRKSRLAGAMVMAGLASTGNFKKMGSIIKAKWDREDQAEENALHSQPTTVNHNYNTTYQDTYNNHNEQYFTENHYDQRDQRTWNSSINLNFEGRNVQNRPMNPNQLENRNNNQLGQTNTPQLPDNNIIDGEFTNS